MLAQDTALITNNRGFSGWLLAAAIFFEAREEDQPNLPQPWWNPRKVGQGLALGGGIERSLCPLYANACAGNITRTPTRSNRRSAIKQIGPTPVAVRVLNNYRRSISPPSVRIRRLPKTMAAVCVFAGSR